ncbi:hypothetical protein ACLB2K_001759 [Fragaria x ananassa]
MVVLLAVILQSSRIYYMPRSPQFWVDSAAISQLSMSDNYELTATWHLTLFVVNPNQILGLHYESLKVMLFYGDKENSHKQTLAGQPVFPPFFLSTREVTNLKFMLATKKAYVGKEVANKIREEMAGESLVRFGLSLFVWYRRDVKPLIDPGPRFLRIFCDPVEFGFTLNDRIGNLTARPMACKLDNTLGRERWTLLLDENR